MPVILLALLCAVPFTRPAVASSPVPYLIQDINPIGDSNPGNLINVKGYIKKLSTNNGLTQIRLRFKLDDNNNAIANYLNLLSGNATVANRPQLVITYSLP